MADTIRRHTILHLASYSHPYILPRMKTTLQRWGNSQGIRIPKALIKPLGLSVGSELELTVSPDESQIMISPARDQRPVRGRHSIADLIAASDPKAFGGETDWDAPQGKEIW